MPPPSSGGGVVITALNMLRADDLPALEHDSPTYLHLLTEALQFAFADRAAYYGDPDFVRVPLRACSHRGRGRALRTANERGDDVLARRTTAIIRSAADRGTSHLSVVDRAGNAVAATTSINTPFGSMVVAGGTGIILNDTMDDFSAQPGVPNAFGLIGSEANAIAPRKRPLSSMTPTIVTRGGQVVAVAGGSGGPFIITGTLQVLLNALVFGQDADAAVAAARIHDAVDAAAADGRDRESAPTNAGRCGAWAIATSTRRAAVPCSSCCAPRTASGRRGRPAQGRRRGGVVRRVSRLRTALASRWFKVLLSVALLALLLSRTDVERDARRARRRALRAGWLLALAAFAVSQVVSAYRWALLARAVGFARPFGRICVYYFSGMYLNLFGPGTVAGDIGRALFLAGGQRRALALTTVIAHRAIGFVVLVWISARRVVACARPTAPRRVSLVGGAGDTRDDRRVAVGPTLDRAAVAAHQQLPGAGRARSGAVLARSPLARRLDGMGSWLPRRFRSSVRSSSPTRSGMRLPWAFFLVVVPLISIVGTLPFSLQGIGVREAGYWYYLARIGVQREAALAFGLLTSAVVLLSGLTGLPAFLMLRQEHADFTAEDAEGAEVSQRGRVPDSGWPMRRRQRETDSAVVAGPAAPAPASAWPPRRLRPLR